MQTTETLKTTTAVAAVAMAYRDTVVAALQRQSGNAETVELISLIGKEFRSTFPVGSLALIQVGPEDQDDEEAPEDEEEITGRLTRQALNGDKSKADAEEIRPQPQQVTLKFDKVEMRDGKPANRILSKDAKDTISRAVNEFDNASAAGMKLVVKPSEAVTDEYVYDPLTGSAFRTLKRHITNMGFTDFEHYRKWVGLPNDFPSTAKNYSEYRATIAKERFGKAAIESRKTEAATKAKDAKAEKSPDASETKKVEQPTSDGSPSNVEAILKRLDETTDTTQRHEAALDETVTPNFIISLLTGKKVRHIRKHVETGDELLNIDPMTWEEYLVKFNLPSNYPEVSEVVEETASGRNKRSAKDKKTVAA